MNMNRYVENTEKAFEERGRAKRRGKIIEHNETIFGRNTTNGSVQWRIEFGRIVEVPRGSRRAARGRLPAEVRLTTCSQLSC